MKTELPGVFSRTTQWLVLRCSNVVQHVVEHQKRQNIEVRYLKIWANWTKSIYMARYCKWSVRRKCGGGGCVWLGRTDILNILMAHTCLLLWCITDALHRYLCPYRDWDWEHLIVWVVVIVVYLFSFLPGSCRCQYWSWPLRCFTLSDLASHNGPCV